MTDKILTVVIPTYNMEKYLDKNLKSLVISDKELMKSLEVLVVNDGSKDGSSVIGHHYQDMYPYTFRVIDKENGNYGSCVNRGLKEAKGKYIRIMDADDWYDTANFELFLRKIRDVNVDKIATIFSEVRTSGKTIMQQPYEPEVVLDMKDVTLVHYIPMHAITYRTELLREIHYSQTEGRSYTDQEWILLPMPYVKTLYYIPLDVYQYYIGREGQTMDVAVIKKSYPQLFAALQRVMEEYSTTVKLAPNPEYVLENVSRTISWIYFVAFIQANFQGETECVKEMDELIEQSYPSLYRRLEEISYSDYFQFRYVHEWRRKGRPLHLPETYIRVYKISHLYILLYRIPAVLWGKVKRRIVSHLKAIQ